MAAVRGAPDRWVESTNQCFYRWVHGVREGSGGFGRVREGSGGFGRVREGSEGFGRVREGSGEFGRVRVHCQPTLTVNRLVENIDLLMS